MSNIVNYKPLYQALNEVLMHDNIKDIDYIFIHVDRTETGVKPSEVIEFVRFHPRTVEANVEKVELDNKNLHIYASTR